MYYIHTDQSVQIGHTIFHPWPDFKLSGIATSVPARLRQLLTQSDPIASTWRSAIPQEVLQALISYPEPILPELIRLAQGDESRFVDWTNFCPALILLLLQPKQPNGFADAHEAVRLMRQGWRSVLRERGWTPKLSTLRILRKVDAATIHPSRLSHLKLQLKDPRKARLIRHLKRINGCTIDTLHLPSYTLSTSLLEIGTRQSQLIQALSIRELCEELMQFRREVGLHPVWPYRNGHISEKTLFHAEQLLLMRDCMTRHSEDLEFPSPPIEGFCSSKFEVLPIRTVRQLYHEGVTMGNCLPSYVNRVADGNHYVYRVLKPERASLVMQLSPDGWRPWQIKTTMNQEAASETSRLVEAWADAKFPKKEVFDGPF